MASSKSAFQLIALALWESGETMRPKLVDATELVSAMARVFKCEGGIEAIHDPYSRTMLPGDHVRCKRSYWSTSHRANNSLVGKVTEVYFSGGRKLASVQWRSARGYETDVPLEKLMRFYHDSFDFAHSDSRRVTLATVKWLIDRREGNPVRYLSTIYGTGAVLDRTGFEIEFDETSAGLRDIINEVLKNVKPGFGGPSKIWPSYCRKVTPRVCTTHHALIGNNQIDGRIRSLMEAKVVLCIVTPGLGWDHDDGTIGSFIDLVALIRHGGQVTIPILLGCNNTPEQGIGYSGILKWLFPHCTAKLRIPELEDLSVGDFQRLNEGDTDLIGVAARSIISHIEWVSQRFEQA